MAAPQTTDGMMRPNKSAGNGGSGLTAGRWEEFLRLLEGLQSAIAESRLALARLDLGGIESSLARQAELCRRGALLRSELDGAALDAPLLMKLKTACAATAQANRVQAALLAAARRSAQIWANVFACSPALRDGGSDGHP
jgi:hypothetical protein